MESAQSWQRPTERFEDVCGRPCWSVHARCYCTNDTGDVVRAFVEKSTDKLIGGTSDEGFDFHCGPGGDFPTEPPFVRYAEVDNVEDRRCERYRSFSFTISSATNRLGRAILCPSVATRNVGKASLNLVPRRDLEDLR